MSMSIYFGLNSGLLLIRIGLHLAYWFNFGVSLSEILWYVLTISLSGSITGLRNSYIGLLLLEVDATYHWWGDWETLPVRNIDYIGLSIFIWFDGHLVKVMLVNSRVYKIICGPTTVDWESYSDLVHW
jgi:hypothetical protein